VDRILVADHSSNDETVEIARSFGAEVHREDRGLAYSRALLLGLARTPYVVFLDSDVVIQKPTFWAEAMEGLGRPGVGAVVGMARGHRFLYGLPFSLTVLRRAWAVQVQLPEDVQARETYYFQQKLSKDRLRVAYVLEAMDHHSLYRGHKFEWEGAATRRVAGRSPYEFAYGLTVILLIHLNSRSARNIAYTPIAWAKFMRGFADPDRWMYLDRRVEPEG
jgi:glycosyltransferase involved in cell wall biosynthesis